MERVKGIEPSYSAWEAAALPLSYTRLIVPHGATHSALAAKPASGQCCRLPARKLAPMLAPKLASVTFFGHSQFRTSKPHNPGWFGGPREAKEPIRRHPPDAVLRF